MQCSPRTFQLILGLAVILKINNFSARGCEFPIFDTVGLVSYNFLGKLLVGLFDVGNPLHFFVKI